MVKIRPATVADTSSIAFVDVETWRAAYAGILPNEVLLGLSLQQREAAWGRAIYRQHGNTLIAVTDAGDTVGFVSCGLNREATPRYSAQVYTLYVLPDFHGQNLGRALLLAAFQRLTTLGHNSAVIWVVGRNPARFFYERLGGRKIASKRVMMGYNTLIDTIGYGWDDLAGTISGGGRTQPHIADDFSSA